MQAAIDQFRGNLQRVRSHGSIYQALNLLKLLKRWTCPTYYALSG